MGFKDQVVLVTGGARGIGQAVSAAFARAGAGVVINDSEPSALLEKMVQEPPFCEVNCLTVQADVGDPVQVGRMMEEVEKAFGRLDVLVNNAGIIRRGRLEKMTMEDWEAVIRVNLTGSFLCARAASRIMIRQARGKIVNVSSVAAKLGDITSAPGYGPSKAGLDALTKTLARELAPHGVNVNSVAPHAIETEMSDQWPEEKRRRIIEAIPLKRLGRPEEVAEAGLFLASDKADFITGEILDVNGGFLMD